MRRGRVGDAVEPERYLATPHYDVTAALPDAFEAVFGQEIAQLRARKDAQLRHASVGAP